jgi:hypothetical protein
MRALIGFILRDGTQRFLASLTSTIGLAAIIMWAARIH